MTAPCPSDLALEAYLLERDRSPLAKHVEQCSPCTTRVARMEAEGEDFRRFVFPATVDAVEEAAARKSRFAFRWPMLLAPLGAVAAVALALVVGIRSAEGPREDYLGVKGGGLGLAVFVNDREGAKAIEDGAAVPATAALRFKIQPSADCWVWVVSVDAKGAVSQLYPPEGAAPDLRAAGALPGGAVLDGQPGPERIYAVCAPDARTSFGDVKAAAEASAAGGPERVRAARTLGRPLAEARQATVLLEKKP